MSLFRISVLLAILRVHKDCKDLKSMNSEPPFAQLEASRHAAGRVCQSRQQVHQDAVSHYRPFLRGFWQAVAFFCKGIHLGDHQRALKQEADIVWEQQLSSWNRLHSFQ